MSSTRHARNAAHRANAQRGATAVELALVLPVLLLLLFGIFEIANILRIQFTLQSAVTTIARDAAMHYTTQASAEQYMNDNGLLPGVMQDGNSQANAPKLTLTPPETSSCKTTPCTPFEVKLSYTYMAIINPMKPFFDNIVLTAAARKASEPWGQ